MKQEGITIIKQLIFKKFEMRLHVSLIWDSFADQNPEQTMPRILSSLGGGFL